MLMIAMILSGAMRNANTTRRAKVGIIVCKFSVCGVCVVIPRPRLSRWQCGVAPDKGSWFRPHVDTPPGEKGGVQLDSFVSA
jgi:hypothetical protein